MRRKTCFRHVHAQTPLDKGNDIMTIKKKHRHIIIDELAEK